MTSTALETSRVAALAIAEKSTHVVPTEMPAIRPFMRDAALLVATLATGGMVPDPAALAQRGSELLDEFDAALLREGIDERVRNHASVALCALLDETALRHLGAQDRSGWELAPLQVQRFRIHDAGERVFANLDEYLSMPGTAVAILEFYSAILGLGLVGRYALSGDAARRELVSALDARIAQRRPETVPPFVIERTNRRLSERLYRLSPWAMAGLTCLIAVLVWGGWSAALNAQLSRLESAQGNSAPHAVGTRS